MNYRDYIFQKKAKPNYFKLSLKWAKIILYLFLIVSMLWGCGELFVPKFNSYQVADISGQNVYKPGVFFEIVIGSIFGKHNYFHVASNGSIHEYSYLAISNWKQAFTKTQSPFFGCFVYPTAWLLIQFINAFGGTSNGAGVIGAIFITSVLVRSITLIFSFKSQMNQEKMQGMQLKQSAIQAKYKNSMDPAAKQKRQMEIMQLYRKEGMSPLSSIGLMFLSYPFLIAMYTVIKSLRQLRITKIGAISLIDRPWHQIITGHPIYLVLLAVYLPLQILSMLLPMLLSLKSTKIVTASQKSARKKQLIIQGVMSLVFMFIAISIAAGVAVYWIFSAFIQCSQTLFFHFLRYTKKARSRQAKIQKHTLLPWYTKVYNNLLKLVGLKKMQVQLKSYNAGDTLAHKVKTKKVKNVKVIEPKQNPVYSNQIKKTTLNSNLKKNKKPKPKANNKKKNNKNVIKLNYDSKKPKPKK